jgi:predicted nucleic acid-binding protein
MERFIERLNEHHQIGLDTAIFIYHFERNPRYFALTQALLSGIETERWEAITSTVTVMEITVRPWQLNRPEVAQAYEEALTHFPNLTVYDINRDIAQQAARLRARYRVRPADALQIATAIVRHATAFVTNDHQLSRLSPDIEVMVLDEFTVA